MKQKEVTLEADDIGQRVRWQASHRNETTKVCYEGVIEYAMPNNVVMIKADRLKFPGISKPWAINSWHQVNRSRLTYL